MNKNTDTDNSTKTNINWYPGHMAKTRRQLKEIISLIDVIYEVIDARMPISSKIADIDELIKDKRKILIVTKYDLCDKVETDRLLKQYENNDYTVIPVELLNNSNLSIVFSKTNDIMKDLNADRARKGLKPRAARVLVIGVPNVGKSTLINRLVGRKATKVGNTPGVTKSTSWIRIKDNIELMDSPGILWPKIEVEEHGYNLASLSSIREDILDSEDICRYIIDKMLKLYPDNLKNRYNLTNTNEKLDIYNTIAKKRGLLLKGGDPDYEKVYLTVIRDLKDGYLGKVTFDR